MLEELKAGSRVVGAKQTRRALKDGRAKRVYMAKDADPRLLQPLVQEAVRQRVPSSRWTPCASWERPAASPWAPPSWRRYDPIFLVLTE